MLLIREYNSKRPRFPVHIRLYRLALVSAVKALEPIRMPSGW